MKLFILAIILILSSAVAMFAATPQERTDAKNAFQVEWFDLESANNGLAAQCDDDVELFEEHEATEPAGQAAYDASPRAAQAAAHKAAGQALRDAAHARLNQPHQDNPYTVGASESLLNAAYAYYAAGDDKCIALFVFAETHSELTKLDIMTESVKQTQVKQDEKVEFNDWLANQGGGSGS